MNATTLMTPSIQQAADAAPAGSWAIGVSGGADSVALLRLVQRRPDVALHVVHLNHQTRGAASDGDATFVRSLADQLSLPCTIVCRTELEADAAMLPTNLSARYRRLRQLLFSQVVHRHNLIGVLVAHHADDQAETILQRLLRGSGWNGLCGMSNVSQVRTLTICRPILTIFVPELRRFLHSLDQPWREDASNASDLYQRNRIRRFLREHGELIPILLSVGATARDLRAWLDLRKASLPDSFDARHLSDQPHILARRSATSWLRERGVSPAKISPQVVNRLLTLASDAASPHRVTFPGTISIRRRRGRITASSPLEGLQRLGSSPSAARACPSNG